MLNQSQIPLKTWADKIGVSERFIQMISSGTRIIPGQKLEEIFDCAPKLLREQRECIDRLMDDLMEAKFNERDKGY